MDSFQYSINATMPIFLVMIVGAVIKKLGIIDDHFVNKANKYVFNIALPFLLFKDIADSDISSRFDMKFMLYCMLVTTICFAGIWALTEWLMKDDGQKGSFVQGAFRGSAAILGVAFIQNLYGNSGMAPLMIVSAVPLYNIFSVIVLTFKAHPENEENGGAKKAENEENGGAKKAENAQYRKSLKRSVINVIKNPIIIGIVLGIPFSFFCVDFPFIIDKTIESVAQTATPIALIAIGAGFQGSKAVKKVVPAMLATFIKLIGQTAVFLPIAIAMGFRNQELLAILIMLGSPATVSGYIMAKNMHNDELLASSIIMLSTLLSVGTLTGWIFLLRYLGYLA